MLPNIYGHCLLKLKITQNIPLDLQQIIRS